MFTVLVGNLRPHMFKYQSVDVTSHLIVSISIFRWRKCVHPTISFMCFLFLVAHPAFTINWLFHDVPLTKTHTECLILGCYYKLSVSPFRPELHNCTRDFYLSTDGLSRSRYNFPCTSFLVSSSTIMFSMPDWSWSLIFVAPVSCIIHLCFIRLASFCREYFVFLASYSCTNLISLSLPCLMNSLRPTIVALHADSSSTYPHPPFCPLM